MLHKNEIRIDDICYFIDKSSNLLYGKVVALFTDGTVYLEDIFNKDADELYIVNCVDVYYAQINERILLYLGFNKNDKAQYIKIVGDFEIIINNKSSTNSIIKNNSTKEECVLPYVYSDEEELTTCHQLCEDIYNITGYYLIE